jgi:hypothetical protein
MATSVPETERDPSYEGQERDQDKTDRLVKEDKIELQDSDAYDKLGYRYYFLDYQCNFSHVSD